MCPQSGPLVVVANHPYGVLDGIAICWLVAQRRKDFKILINSVLCRAREMTDHVLPIDFEPTPQALETNLQSRKLARTHLETGGVVIVFPSGGIATTPKLFSREAKKSPGRHWSGNWCGAPKPRFYRCFLTDKTRNFFNGQPYQLCHARRLDFSRSAPPHRHTARYGDWRDDGFCRFGLAFAAQKLWHVICNTMFIDLARFLPR